MNAVPPATPQQSLLDLLELEEIDRDIYRADLVYADQHALYGGQVAAQALMAAGRTVAPARTPHSLHGYFLRPGDANRPTVFRVERDRDGRSFSARRVVALQDGQVLFNLSCSFAVPEDGPDQQVDPVPDAEAPEGLPVSELPRLLSMESRLPTQPCEFEPPWPVRFWARATVTLPDDELFHACALTYLSDIHTGVAALPGSAERTATSIDHAVWFHRPVRLDDWLLMNLVPHSTANGRGLYSGTVHDRAGVLAATLSQEVLYRLRPPAPREGAQS
jgi:acyl-CoA thioesterase II